MSINEERASPDVISCYFYQLKEMDGNQCKLDFVWKVLVVDWLAEKNLIENWSYHRIMRETDKAILLDGIDREHKDRWLAKSQIEFGDKIREHGEYFLAHRSSIREIEEIKGLYLES